MHLRWILLSAVAAGVVVLAGCGPVDDAGTSDEVDTTAPASSAAASPSPSPSPATAATEDDAGEDDAADEPAGGDCAAYVDWEDWCLPGVADYDCEGGPGDGPGYAPRGVEVVEPGVDPFGLDRDNDGEGCEASRPDPEPEPEPEPEPDTDPRFGTCGEAIDAGYGPYYRGSDPEYDWYRDADSDGVVCE